MAASKTFGKKSNGNDAVSNRPPETGVEHAVTDGSLSRDTDPKASPAGEAGLKRPSMRDAAPERSVSKQAVPEQADLKRTQSDHSLAKRCQDAFEHMVKAGSDLFVEAERDALAVQALLDGAGVNTAGVARFSANCEMVIASYQSTARMLQESAMVTVSDAACTSLLLNGGAVNIAEQAKELCADDALISKIGMESFMAEPMRDVSDGVIGFLFLADDKPMREGGMALRAFFESVATWLRDNSKMRDDSGDTPEEAEEADDPRPRPRLDEQTELLVETLKYVGPGIMVFDRGLKIIAVNEQTLRLLDVPETVLHVGASMPDLIDYFGQRGDYGLEDRDQQIARLADIADRREAVTFERHLANGRVVSCDAQPRDNGGYVLSYTDVTDLLKREEERLENSGLLSDTLNHMEQGLIVFDAALSVLSVNAQANSMLGVSENVLHAGSSLRGFIAHCARRGDFGDGDPEKAAEQIYAVLRRGDAFEIECQLDEDRTVVCSARPRSDGGYIATYTDVSRWRQSEQELDAKADLLSVALDYMDQGLIVYDGNFVIQAFNDRAKSLLKVSDHALHEGGSMVTLMEFWITQAADSPVQAEQQVQTVQKQIESGEAFAFEQQLPCGTALSCAGRPRVNGGYVVTLEDITESKRQERELAEKTAMLEATIQHMDQGLLAFDGDLKILFANERAKMMTGIPREMLQPGESFEDIVRFSAERGAYDEDTNGFNTDQLIANARGSEPFSMERKCSGNTTALVRCHPRPHGGYIMTYTDITATKRQQHELSEMAEALRQKSVQLDRVFTNMGSGVAMFDADCCLVICNPRYREMFQLPEKLAVPGVSLAEMFKYCLDQGFEEGSDKQVSDRLKLARSRKPNQFKMHMTDDRVIDVIHEPLEDGGSIAVYEDVTIRETAEKKLRAYASDLEKQKTLLQTVMENIDQGISLVDGDLVLQAFNSRFLELLEFPPKKFKVGDPMAKFFGYNAERGEYGPGDPVDHVRARMDLAKKFEPHCFHRERPDGTVLEIKGKPLEGGKGIVTTYTDVTDIRGSEQKVQALTDRVTETDQQLDAAFNSMNQGLAMFDADHKLVVRNKRYLEIFQFPEDLATTGASLEDITRYSVEQGYEADPEHAVERRMEIANMRERTIYHRKMADDRILEIIHEPLDHGSSLALYLDVTAREASELRLREYTSKLETSNRELQDFAYVASHDLQEPLRKIEAFGDRLHSKFSEQLGDDGMQYVDRMQNSSRRLRALIDALLDYSRVTSKGTPFETVDLNRLARDVQADMEPSIEEVGATIGLGKLPTIEGDETQLRQLFVNLISNSLKFHKEDTPPKLKIAAKVTKAQTSKGEKGEVCVLSFVDNGIGFDNKYTDRMFTIFQRLHSRSEYEGTGVGLASCRKIAERHNGVIVADGSPDKGAVFRVALPVVQNGEAGGLVRSVMKIK